MAPFHHSGPFPSVEPGQLPMHPSAACRRRSARRRRRLGWVSSGAGRVGDGDPGQDSGGNEGDRQRRPGASPVPGRPARTARSADPGTPGRTPRTRRLHGRPGSARVASSNASVLKDADPREIVDQLVRELGEREDERQVEEQFQERGALRVAGLPAAPPPHSSSSARPFCQFCARVRDRSYRAPSHRCSGLRCLVGRGAVP